MWYLAVKYHKGYVLAQTLFSMMFSAMLTGAFRDCDTGIPIKYCFDGKLFDRRRMQAKSKVQTDEFLYAHDMAKNASTESHRSSFTSLWQLWSQNQHKKDWGSIPASTCKALQRANHHSEWTKLQVVDKFTYLGSTLCRAVHIDNITARIAKTSVAFGRLYEPRQANLCLRAFRHDKF